jgi:hypothetical protein
MPRIQILFLVRISVKRPGETYPLLQASNIRRVLSERKRLFQDFPTEWLSKVLESRRDSTLGLTQSMMGTRQQNPFVIGVWLISEHHTALATVRASPHKRLG